MNLDAQNLLVYSEELRECIKQRHCSRLLKEFVSYGEYIQGTEPELMYVTEMSDPSAFPYGHKEMLLSYKNAQQRLFYNSSPWVFHPSTRSNDNTDERISDFVSLTIKLKNALRDSRDSDEPIGVIVQNLFDLSEQHLKGFNRLAENQTMWITVPLFAVAKQFFCLASGFDAAFNQARTDLLEQGELDPNNVKNNDNNDDEYQVIRKSNKVGNLDKESFLEKASRTIQNSYKICLNDRETDPRISKLSNVYCFINLNFAIYQKLGKSDLEKSYVKVLRNRILQNQLPDVSSSGYFSNFDKMWFNFYMGKHYISLNDCSSAVKYLLESFQFCNFLSRAMIHKILHYLIPAYICHNQKIPSLFNTNLIPDMWKTFIEFLNKGDLKNYMKWISQHEIFLLKNNLMPIVLNIKDLCTARFLQIFWKMNNEATILDSTEFSELWNSCKRGKPFVINGFDETSINEEGIFKALNEQINNHENITEKLHTKEEEEDHKQELIDEIENVFTNLIRKRYLNGYISHGNKKLVVSKTLPFPVFQK